MISRPGSRDSSALEFILSLSRSRSRDLKTQVSVLVSRSNKGLDNNTDLRFGQKVDLRVDIEEYTYRLRSSRSRYP